MALRSTIAAVVGAIAVASALVDAQRRSGEARQGGRRAEPESASVRRIQTRTYRFERTNEMLEYAVAGNEWLPERDCSNLGAVIVGFIVERVHG